MHSLLSLGVSLFYLPGPGRNHAKSKSDVALNTVTTPHYPTLFPVKTIDSIQEKNHVKTTNPKLLWARLQRDFSFHSNVEWMLNYFPSLPILPNVTKS